MDPKFVELHNIGGYVTKVYHTGIRLRGGKRHPTLSFRASGRAETGVDSTYVFGDYPGYRVLAASVRGLRVYVVLAEPVAERPATLDEQIASEILGWEKVPERVINGISCGPGWWDPRSGDPLAGSKAPLAVPPYSSKLELAFKAVREATRKWGSEYSHVAAQAVLSVPLSESAEATATATAKAICRALLATHRLRRCDRSEP